MNHANENSSIHKNGSEENVVRHTNSDSVENVEKLIIRTKNGLVNGVAEDKCKNIKKHAKTNINTNMTKESKRNKKGHSSSIQLNDVELSNSDVLKKNKSGQKSYKIESSNPKNCIPENKITEKAKFQSSQISAKDSSSAKANLNIEISQLKPDQSEVNSTTQSSSKTGAKRKKNKSKINKGEQNLQTDQSSFNLPKFDITSIINSTINSENLISKIPEAASASHLVTNNPHLLECQDNSSEFEKDLIESIKNLKIQQDAIPADIHGDRPVESKTEHDAAATGPLEENLPDITYVQYESELQMPLIMKIIQKDLSEPYSIYTYRYFIHNWPKLCFLAMCEEKCVGAIVCKLDFHRKSTKRGYIAMLAVDKDYRKRRIGSTLVRRAIKEMIAGGADEVVLETEVTNKPALRLYEQLGFVRDKRLFRYYLNGVDALRLKLWLR